MRPPFAEQLARSSCQQNLPYLRSNHNHNQLHRRTSPSLIPDLSNMQDRHALYFTARHSSRLQELSKILTLVSQPVRLRGHDRGRRHEVPGLLRGHQERRCGDAGALIGVGWIPVGKVVGDCFLDEGGAVEGSVLKFEFGQASTRRCAIEQRIEQELVCDG